MTSQITMPESEFHTRVDGILERLQMQIDELDTDADAEVTSGILTVDFADRSKIIVNRQTPNREIWVAAKSGGFHFQFDGHNWRDTRSAQLLAELLSKLLSEQLKSKAQISLG
jgi:CyaY protein